MFKSNRKVHLGKISKKVVAVLKEIFAFIRLLAPNNLNYSKYALIISAL